MIGVARDRWLGPSRSLLSVVPIAIALTSEMDLSHTETVVGIAIILAACAAALAALALVSHGTSGRRHKHAR
jgi:hypothetical protein